MTDYSLNDRWQENRSAWKDYWDKFTLDKFAVTLIILALAIVGFGYFNQHGSAINWTNIFGDFYANVSSELVSIVITVLVLERLNARRQDKQELTRLKALLGSDESVVTKIAIAELRARGWLYDGSLADTELWRANLMGADLRFTNLSRTRLNNANLKGIRLDIADLTGADLEHANLAKANIMNTSLMNANLEKANFADAQLFMVNLTGTYLRYANFRGTNLLYTILPDGTAWSKHVNLKRFTHPEHPEFEETLAKIEAIRQELRENQE